MGDKSEALRSNMAALNNKRPAKRKLATGNFKRVTANSSLLGSRFPMKNLMIMIMMMIIIFARTYSVASQDRGTFCCEPPEEQHTNLW